MIALDEFRQDAGYITFPPVTPEGKAVQPKAAAKPAAQAVAGPRVELDLSGFYILVGFATAFCSVSLMLWALLKLWIFGQ